MTGVRVFVFLGATLLVAIGTIVGILAVPSSTTIVGLPRSTQFIAQYGHPGGRVVLEAFSLDSGRPIGEVSGSPIGPNEVGGPWRGANDALWYSTSSGPRCPGPNELPCRRNNCSDAVVRLDPRTGVDTVVLR